MAILVAFQFRNYFTKINQIKIKTFDMNFR